MPAACEVTPISAFLSTNLNNKIECYERLGERIKRSLGYPLISLEIHQDQLYENIQIGVEMFSKFAGYTREYLIFDSNLYEKNKGIRLDYLFTIANTERTPQQKVSNSPAVPDPNYSISTPNSVFIATSAISNTFFSTSSALSSLYTEGIDQFDILDQTLYSSLTSFSRSLTAAFVKSPRKTITLACEPTTAVTYSNAFDYDIMDYRKVVDVVDFEEGSTTGINTLFTLEQTLAQQTYFSYALGNYGFDLLSWYSLKEFMDTREKLLATTRDLKFDPRTQYLTMYPQPNKNRFYGVISCYVERPIRDIVKEQWVYQYALALCKITIGRVRSKFGGVSLLGGGSLNYDLLQEGLTEKKELEALLYTGPAPGLSDSEPAMFFVG
jgi:hypothetical protein